VTCRETLDEFAGILNTKFFYSIKDVNKAVEDVRRFSTVCTISGNLKVVASDSADDKIVECAVVGGATHIVTGDRQHLLPMREYENIAIVSPSEFLRIVATET
jgi:predicted nucleic acid-binding protein